MTKVKEFAEIAARLMRCPAAPYHEEGVRLEVERICEENGLVSSRDAFGNLMVRLPRKSRDRALVLAAHMDHPGFRIVRGLGERAWLGEFLGGVPEEFFHPGTRLRLEPGDTPARLGRRVGAGKTFEITASRLKYSKPAFAVWDIKNFEAQDGQIRGRSCDDLIGVATILAVLIELQRTGARCHVMGLISRAEEVGFQGALAAADAGSIPKTALVISLETSRELPPVKMGDGVIIRVGDRSSVFDPEATRFLTEVANELQAKKGLRFQRALMSGGTCEGTAYQTLGFQTGAVCVALGNYHNCGAGGKIAAEYVSLADAISMVELLVEVALRIPAYARLVGKLPERLRGLLREARRALTK